MKLLTLAIACGIVTPLAGNAQNATVQPQLGNAALAEPQMFVLSSKLMNVTLYGRVHLDYEFVNGRQADGTNPTINRLNSNASRFGIRGNRAFSDDLSGIFQIESGVSPDASGGTLASRDSFVGVSSKKYGTFRFGRILTPTDAMASYFWINPVSVAASTLAPYNLWAGNANNPLGGGGFDVRNDNSILWDSPSWNGLTTSWSYGTFENSRHGNIVDGIVWWKNGAAQVAVSHQIQTKIRAADTSDKASNLSAGYTLGNWTFSGGLEHLQLKGNGLDMKRNFFALAAAGNYAPHRFYAMFGNARNWAGTGTFTTTGVATTWNTGSDSGAKQFVLAYGYDLFPGAGVYVGYHRINNDARANYTFSNTAYAVAPGAKPQLIAVGMYMSF